MVKQTLRILREGITLAWICMALATVAVFYGVVAFSGLSLEIVMGFGFVNLLILGSTILALVFLSFLGVMIKKITNTISSIVIRLLSYWNHSDDSKGTILTRGGGYVSHI